jgi:fatty-acyl-CoA synthase
VTEPSYLPLLEGLDLGVGDDRVLVTGTPAYDDLLRGHQGAPVPEEEIAGNTQYLLLFTSGTTGAPKACICSQGRLARIGETLGAMYQLGPADVVYEVMPMFHSNALMAGWAPALAGASTVALRRKFSASNFLADVRKFGATYFNYVGRPLSYILATPEQPDDTDNPLRQVFGNEGADLDLERFAKRFGVPLNDGFGSTEGGATVRRTDDMPSGALGVGDEHTVILDAETGEECPRARFDADGHLLNAEEAIGEIVNRVGARGFEGYYKNDEANAARTRGGMYWSGDLGYRDEAGFFYFAGRDAEWLRVDGENFAAAPVERILARHPDVVLTAVYAVPDPNVGDQVMAALQLRPGSAFDADDFDRFLTAQSDLGTKWAPRFVRVMDALPVTQTSKILKKDLRRQRWDGTDPVWWRPAKGEAYRRMTDADRDGLLDAFAAAGRSAILERV